MAWEWIVIGGMGSALGLYGLYGVWVVDRANKRQQRDEARGIVAE